MKSICPGKWTFLWLKIVLKEHFLIIDRCYIRMLCHDIESYQLELKIKNCLAIINDIVSHSEDVITTNNNIIENVLETIGKMLTEEFKNTSDICRYMFMKIIVLVSQSIYIDILEVASEIATAVELFMEDFFVPYANATGLQKDENEYRKNRIYNKSVGKELKSAQDTLKRVFIRYCKRPKWINDEIFKEQEEKKMVDAIKEAEEKAKKGKKKKQKKVNDDSVNPLTGSRKLSPKGRKVYWMDLTNWLEILNDLKLFNEDFSVRDGRRCFFLSRMMSKDESKYLLIRKTLNYADFLEAICRLVDNLQIPMKAELKANEVSTFSELLIKRQIEHAVGDDTLDGWNSVGMHKAWKMKEPMTGSLVSKLSIMMPFLVDQIKNSIAIGKIKSVERAKIKNQLL